MSLQSLPLAHTDILIRRFLRGILDDPPLVIENEDLQKIEEQNAKSKQSLKEKKASVASLKEKLLALVNSVAVEHKKLNDEITEHSNMLDEIIEMNHEIKEIGLENAFEDQVSTRHGLDDKTHPPQSQIFYGRCFQIFYVHCSPMLFLSTWLFFQVNKLTMNTRL